MKNFLATNLTFLRARLATVELLQIIDSLSGRTLQLFIPVRNLARGKSVREEGLDCQREI